MAKSMKMVDITEKAIVERLAVAEGEIVLGRESIEGIKKGTIKKGDVLTTAQVAGMLAVKGTPGLIPLCHPIPEITDIKIEFEIGTERIKCTCEVKGVYKTGLEMEALTGVGVALLTVWDMVKYLEKDAEGQYPRTAIENIKVLEKSKRSY